MTTPLAIRIAGYQGANSIHTRALELFCDTLEMFCADSIAIEKIFEVIKHGESAQGMFDKTGTGGYHICYMASSYLSKKVPALYVLDLPFLVTDRHKAYATLDGSAGALLQNEIETTSPYKLLGYWDNGFRHVSNAKRPIRTPDDCRGITIRTLNNDLYKETLAAIGFSPLFLDVKDLVAAIAENRVDAQENPLTNILTFELQRYHPYVSLTGHIYGVALFVCNKAWFEALPADLRQALQSAAKEATTAQRRFAEDIDNTAINTLRSQGIEVLEPAALDMPAFHTAVAPVLQRERDKLDPEILEKFS